MKTFIENCRELINTLPACTGDTARLAHRLSRACDKMEKLITSAREQFEDGERNAKITKIQIAYLEGDDD